MPNTKNINQVEQLTDKLAKAKSVYFTEYHGLNVEEITELRREFSKNNIEFKWNSKFPINSLYLMRGYLVIDDKFKELFFENLFGRNIVFTFFLSE